MDSDMAWKLLEDPANDQNKNAGNGGDLVKHAVYLSLLNHLLAREPWKKKLIVRECHAGRGIYRINRGDPRSNLISCLQRNTAEGFPILLRDAQRSALEALGGTLPVEKSNWYAGSALLNLLTLSSASGGSHGLELYECMAETRKILRAVLNAARLGAAAAEFSVLPEEENLLKFDGELYIQRNIPHWGKQDVVLLDPFAMWRQSKDQSKRDCYGAIVDSLTQHGTDMPSLVLFWTWGRAFLVADADLAGTAEPVRNGYADLRAKLHLAGLHFVLVKWRWGLQFAMWVVVPASLLSPLREEIAHHCRALSDHLVGQKLCQDLTNPWIDVTID